MKLTIVAHINSRRPKVIADEQGRIHVYTNSPAVDGIANQAITEAIALYFGKSKSKVILKHGIKSKAKVFEIVE